MDIEKLQQRMSASMTGGYPGATVKDSLRHYESRNGKTWEQAKTQAALAEGAINAAAGGYMSNSMRNAIRNAAGLPSRDHVTDELERQAELKRLGNPVQQAEKEKWASVRAALDGMAE